MGAPCSLSKNPQRHLRGNRHPATPSISTGTHPGAPLAPLPADMSQRAVEQVLGRLVTDEGFREAFLADPGGTAARAALDLSPTGLHALTRIPRGPWRACARAWTIGSAACTCRAARARRWRDTDETDSPALGRRDTAGRAVAGGLWRLGSDEGDPRHGAAPIAVATAPSRSARCRRPSR